MLDDVVQSPEQRDEDLVGTVMLDPSGSERPPQIASETGEASFRSGDRVGRYRLIERLGAGGMGVVWVALDPQLDRTVAVKVLHEQRRHGATQARERLRREALALARLSHPNVVSIYDVGVHERRVFLTMEHVVGRTLDVWAAEGPSVAQVLEVFEQAAAGLAAVHEAGFVHRDFKPTNVMIDRDGRVLVMDFGLARVHDPESVSEHDSAGSSSAWSRDGSLLFSTALTIDGVVMGTPAYMAPEQHTGDEADARADQFAFCATLYEVLLGQRPFSGRSVEELARQKHEARLEFRGDRPPLPRALRALLRRGLDPEPSRRHPDMLALRDGLMRVRRPRRRRGMVAVGVGVAMVGAVGWAVLSSPSVAPCEAGAAHMAEIWSDDARTALWRSFQATELPYADDAAQRATGRLDAYAADWADRYAQVCQATGREDAPLLDLRMRCLGDARASMAATVGLLVQADATTVQRAVSQVAELPPLSRCDDAEALGADVPVPVEPAAVAAMDAVHQQLEEAAALDRAGHYEEGRERAEQALQAAIESGYEPSIARARIRLASLELGLGNAEAARRGLSEAALLASGIGDQQAAADAATRLAFVLAADLDRPDEALRWARHAEAALDRLPPDPLARARLDGSLGVIYSTRGEHSKALEAFERAYEAKRAVLGDDHPEVTGALENMALSHGELGHLAEAERLQRSSLAVREKSLGSRHPDLGHSLMNLGYAVDMNGRPDEAAAHYTRALGIFRESLGPHHPMVARTLGSLGHVAMSQDRPREAEIYFRESSEIIEAIHGDRHRELAWSLADRALVTAQLGQGEQAIALYRQAREIIEATAGPDHDSLAFMMMDEAHVLLEEQRTDEAEALIDRAGEILAQRVEPGHPALAQHLECKAELMRAKGRLVDARQTLLAALDLATQALGPEHPNLGFILLELGEVEHELQEDQAALEHLRRAQQFAERPGAGRGFVAATRFGLAKARWSDPTAREDALELARAAHEGFVGLGDGFQEDVAEVGAWLRDRQYPRAR